MNIRISSFLSEKVVLCFSFIVTISVLTWVLFFSRYGIDFSDEGFYLVTIATPDNYSVSSTQFGFIYHPLYKLLNGDIAYLRQANILLVFLLGWILCFVFIRDIYKTQSISTTYGLILSASFSVTSLVYLNSWLLTPSYNSLNFKSLLVFSIGLLLADKQCSYKSIMGWLLIGFAGWLSFMAKPTTALALGIFICLYILLANKFRARLFIASLAFALALVLLSAIMIDGSMLDFIDRLKGGVLAAGMLSDKYTLGEILRFDDFSFSEEQKKVFSISLALIFSSAFFCQMKRGAWSIAGRTLLIFFIVISFVVMAGILPPVDFGASERLLIWSVPIAALLIGVTIYSPQGLLKLKFSDWALILLLLSLPHIYAVGTNGNYWGVGSKVAIFWLLAGLVFLKPIISTERLLAVLFSLSISAQLITVILIYAGMETPYRQTQSLYKHKSTVIMTGIGTRLVVEENYGKYIVDAIEAMKQVNFERGTPMIDLTGQSPTIMHIIGASSIGQAWMIGGYPGSEALTTTMLKKVSCHELSTAWLINEPEGPRKIPSNVLSSFGANINKDYEVVATIITAPGAGFYKEPRLQNFLKPTRRSDLALKACEKYKESMR